MTDLLFDLTPLVSLGLSVPRWLLMAVGAGLMWLMRERAPTAARVGGAAFLAALVLDVAIEGVFFALDRAMAWHWMDFPGQVVWRAMVFVVNAALALPILALVVAANLDRRPDGSP